MISRGGIRLKIAIVDDDRKTCERLCACLDELLAGAAEFACFESGEAFLRAWQPEAFDLVILDMFMRSLTGMEVARAIRASDPRVRLVFCTTSNEFASESYEVDACDYLRKPFSRERVKAMLDRLNLAQLEKMRAVRLPDGASVVLRDVIYADCAAHRVTLHRKRGGDVVVRAAFSEVEPLLCAYPYFFSPTKGVIVNFYEVAAQTGDTFRLSDGSIVPISRRRAKEVLDAYSTFRFEQLRKGGMP